jgi:hypothetical protein
VTGSGKDEMRVIQKRQLTQLKLVQLGLNPIALAVKVAEAEMEAEDVAYVNEIVSGLKNGGGE